MCRALSVDPYWTNFKCPHNLFWEELNLERDKIQMTDKALEIRNCCCLIIHAWTSEEIGEAWGLTSKGIRCSEAEAFKNLKRKVGLNSKRRPFQNTLSREVIH